MRLIDFIKRNIFSKIQYFFNTLYYFIGVYPGVIMTLLLRRKISYHLLQTYLPSGLFVIVAWLSLFLPPESIPGRVTMAMTTLLTLAAMFGAVRYIFHLIYLGIYCVWGRFYSGDQNIGYFKPSKCILYFDHHCKCAVTQKLNRIWLKKQIGLWAALSPI